jgi:hypothetical protein
MEIGHGDSSWNVPEGSDEVEITASTFRASRKIVEDAENFKVFEEITDSDVKIFSAEDDEDVNEPDSGEDGQLDDNSETNKDGLAAQ